MTVLVTYLGTDAQGVAHRDRRSIEGSALRLGRSTGCEIHLPDARVALIHAHIAITDAGAAIEAEGDPIELNGRRVRSAPLLPGDRICIGPYVIDVEAARQGVALALGVRLNPAATSAFWRRPLRRTLPVTKRRLSYLAAGAVLLLFLALPIAGRIADDKDSATLHQAPEVASYLVSAVGARLAQAWNPGPVSRAHEAIADDCRQCHHMPLVQVRDFSCIACHKDITRHVAASTLRGPHAEGLRDRRCAQCHLDHKGRNMAPHAQEDCAECHRDIKRVAPDAESGDVTDFATDHPRFRLSLIDARHPDAVQRIRQGSPVTERSNLKFNHALHLHPDGVRDPKGRRDAAGMRNARGGRTVLKCADCHEMADDGRSPSPVSMDRHCRRCHSLAFEPKLTARQVPHGSEEMATMLGEFYARLALRDAPPAEDAVSGIARARPGAELSYQDRQRVLQIAERNTRQALRELYETRDVCSTCHYVERQRGDAGWKVAPVRITTAWMPNSLFSHARHKTEPCAACHAVTQSKDARDVAMPDIANCRRCHVGARPVRNRVTSDCATCHRFHAGNEVWDPSLQRRARHEAAR